MRVHKGTALIATVAALALVLSACSSSKKSTGGSTTGNGGSSQTGGTKGLGNLADCATKPNTCNSASVKGGGTLTYVLEKTISGWNVNTSNSNTFEFVEVMDGVSPAVFLATPDLKPFLNTDLMVSAEQTNANPQTIVYKIQPGAVWSDGTPINYDDFYFLWKTNDGATCVTGKDKDGNPVNPCDPASTAGYSQIKDMTSSDNGKTVTVTMATPFRDWQSMFGNFYPAHIGLQHGDMKSAAGMGKEVQWFDTTQPTWSGGPYIVQSSIKDTSVTEVPNPKWYGKVKASLDKLVFRIITDQTQEVPAFQNNEVQAMYPQPNADLVQQIQAIQGASSYLGKGLQWEHLDFNEANPLLKDVKLRSAIFTAIDRKQIISKTIGQFVSGATPLGSHMYVPGQGGYTDNVTASDQGNGDVAKAKSILTAAGYTGVGTDLKTPSGQSVSIRCSFTTGNVLRSQTCQLIQSELSALGIKVTPTPLQSLGGALSKGDFDLIIFAWVDTPYAVAGAQQLFTLNGGNDYGKNNDPAMEAKINAAGDPSLTDAQVQADLNAADQMLIADAYELPLYQKPTFTVMYNDIANLRDNATSVGPPYNVQEWGVRASS